MSDFRSMITKAKAAHDEDASEAKRRRDAEIKDRSDFVDSAIAALDQHVAPILRRAAAEFASEQVHSDISTKYDVKMYVSNNVKPMISFRLLGPKRASDGWQLPGIAVFFESDGVQLFVGAGKETYDDKPKTNIGNCDISDGEELIRQAIGLAVDSYFKELKDKSYAYDR